jgi:hypothetical protein
VLTHAFLERGKAAAPSPHNARPCAEHPACTWSYTTSNPTNTHGQRSVAHAVASTTHKHRRGSTHSTPSCPRDPMHPFARRRWPKPPCATPPTDYTRAHAPTTTEALTPSQPTTPPHRRPVGPTTHRPPRTHPRLFSTRNPPLLPTKGTKATMILRRRAPRQHLHKSKCSEAAKKN